MIRSWYEFSWLARLAVRKMKEKKQKRTPPEKNDEVRGSLAVTADQLPKDEAYADYTVENQRGRQITYRSFYQQAKRYHTYSDYCALHGCAVCSLTTLARAVEAANADAGPDTIIEGLEKQAVGRKNWTDNYQKKQLRFQSPVTLFGICRALYMMQVQAEYVKTFEDETARKDILAHLQTGNPVVIEVGRRNYYTGETNSRWTNSYHTMILIGLTTEGKVLVNDSANRSWYKGPQRFKLADLEDLMAYMFSCTEEPEEYYYCGMATDGGYIKVTL